MFVNRLFFSKNNPEMNLSDLSKIMLALGEPEAQTETRASQNSPNRLCRSRIRPNEL
jgi:hypothetical protein